MKTLIITIFILLSMGFACGSPFIICDPYPTAGVQPDYFILSLNGGAPFNSMPQTLPDGSKRLYWDLASVPNGTHRVTIKAVKSPSGNAAGGESSTVPFDFSRGGPQDLKGLGIIQ